MRVASQRRHLDGLGNLLRTLSYQSTLARGFALVRDGEGRMVRQAASIAAGMQLDIELADGRIAARAEAGAVPPARDADPGEQASALSREPRRRSAKGGGGQGSGSGGQGRLF